MTAKKTYEINVDWQEGWSNGADEAVAAGIKLRRVTVDAIDIDDAIAIANAKMLTTEEALDLALYSAGVL